MSKTQHTRIFESLRTARLNRGLSRRKAAIEIGIAPQTYRRLENGDPVSPAKALKVAEYFGVEVTDVMPADGHETKRAA